MTILKIYDINFVDKIHQLDRTDHHLDRLEAQKLVAQYIVKDISALFDNVRITEILDTYTAQGSDGAFLTYGTAKDIHKGYAITSGGEGPLHMYHGDNILDNPTNVENGTINPYQGKVGFSIFEMLRQKFLLARRSINPGKILVECRPEKMVVRKRDSALIEICQNMASSIQKELFINPSDF